MFRGRVRHVHFVGVGGIGMSGIAEVLLALGYEVSGSDLKEGDITRRLVSLGARVTAGHRGELVEGADVVVYSSAVSPENPELVSARAAGVPEIPRAEMLAELMRLKYGIAIAGSHGKTTTTSLVSTVLAAAGLDPTVVIGGKLNAIGTNAKAGAGTSSWPRPTRATGSFLKLSPTIAVVANIDPEHLDHYGSHEAHQGRIRRVRPARALLRPRGDRHLVSPRAVDPAAHRPPARPTARPRRPTTSRWTVFPGHPHQLLGAPPRRGHERFDVHLPGPATTS
ncbi:MAG: Mur ligase domain-containing protein [Polyangiales bacterium]